MGSKVGNKAGNKVGSKGECELVSTSGEQDWEQMRAEQQRGERLEEDRSNKSAQTCENSRNTGSAISPNSCANSKRLRICERSNGRS